MIPDIVSLVSVVRARAGIDLSEYRAQTIERRIRSRMGSVGAGSFEEYRRLLETSPSEVLHLLERITIKVSRFYRGAATFDFLRGPGLAQLARRSRPLRLWSAGCGRGEEAYSLAMLLEEAGLPGEVEASDVDALALVTAAGALYPSESAVELPEELRRRFLEAVPGRPARWRVTGAVRRRVRFARGDLARAPLAPHRGRYDLVCCRNVLIYWQPAMQRRILDNLLACLNEGGLLCLGEAEWPHGPAAACLEPLGERVFRALAAPVQEAA